MGRVAGSGDGTASKNHTSRTGTRGRAGESELPDVERPASDVSPLGVGFLVWLWFVVVIERFRMVDLWCKGDGEVGALEVAHTERLEAA
uniref:Uncharacterized protein n=1 Tax=viral metagenome TaxID=1070528 RepID=A0A6H1ZT08_9ZZZZ